MSHAKQGVGMMRVSSFDRSNWAKMASAAKGAGLESVAKKFRAAAYLPVGEEIPLSVFDQLQAEWRDWLVSGTFRHGVTVQPVAQAVRAESQPQKDLITELRESLEDLLGQADLGEVDEETAPMVERAKAVVKRAEREASELITYIRRVKNAFEEMCSQVPAHLQGTCDHYATQARELINQSEGVQ